MFSFITFLFYLCTIIFIILEIGSIQEAKSITYFREAIKTNKNLKLTAKQSLYGSVQLLYMVWTLIGLFSSQWILFMLIIIISLVILVPNNRSIILMKIDSSICAGILMFIILNKYQFHINLFHYLFKS